MAVLDSIKNFVFGKPNDGYEENYDDAYEEDAYFTGDRYEDDDEDEEPGYTETRSRFRSESRSRRTSFFRNEENDGYSYEEPAASSRGPARIILVKAKRFAEVKRIAENLKQDRSVVINFEDMEKGEAQRTIDFLSGTTYAKDGKIQKVSHCTIIFAVGPVDLIGRIEEIADAENYFEF